MTVVKTMRLVRKYDWNIKTIVFVSVHDKPVPETVIVGPFSYFTRRVLVVTGRNMSEGEVDKLVGKVLESGIRCHKCHHRGKYLKVDIVHGEPDPNTAVCDSCDPTVRYSLAVYEAIDIAFIETRDN